MHIKPESRSAAEIEYERKYPTTMHGTRPSVTIVGYRNRIDDASIAADHIKPMPPEFELKNPRRVRWSTWQQQPSGGNAHFSGSGDATPEQEAWHRINDPERGLHPDDIAAYRESQRGPVVRFFARLKARLRFWPEKKIENSGEFEVPQWLRNMPD